MNRIKRISLRLLERYGELFSPDFDKNKEILDRVAIFRSKGLRNEVAGYITNSMRAEMDGKEDQVQEEEAEDINQETES